MGILITNEFTKNISPVGEKFTITELEKILKGPVTLMFFKDGFSLVVNAHETDINYKATNFITEAKSEIYNCIIIRGNAFLITTNELELK